MIKLLVLSIAVMESMLTPQTQNNPIRRLKSRIIEHLTFND